MHVKRVIEAIADVINGIVTACLSTQRQVILLVVEVHWDGSPVDVFWTPAESHVRLEGVVASHRGQLHRGHVHQDLTLKGLLAVDGTYLTVQIASRILLSWKLGLTA